jgi:hypothetical protein
VRACRRIYYPIILLQIKEKVNSFVYTGKKGEKMILIYGKNKNLCLSAREIFLGMGYIPELADGDDMPEARHHGVIILGRDDRVFGREFVQKLRTGSPKTPIIAVREDLLPVSDGVDAVFPCSLSVAYTAREMEKIAGARGCRKIGEYAVGGLSAAVGEGVIFRGEAVEMTKAEVGILRTLLAAYPSGLSAEEIAALAFRLGREPSASGVRTHISAINRRLREVAGESLLSSLDGRYHIKIRPREAITV